MEQLPLAGAPVPPVAGAAMPGAALPGSAVPVAATPVAATPIVATPVTAVPAGQPAGMPGAGIASPYARPIATPGGYDANRDTSSDEKPSSGRSVGAWFAAVAVGMFVALIWGVIASFTGAGGQVFAWAVGAIVGCIAGLIARNPSIPFCLATTLGALICMLFGRIVSAWVIMLAVSTMTSMQEFGEYLLPDSGVSIGVLESMNEKGQLEAEEKELADIKIKAFFSNQSIYDVPEYDDIDYEAEVELDKKVREVLKDMSEQQKQDVLEKVRAAHPEWMEEPWHFNAVIDSMVVNDEIEDEGVLAHAKSKLTALDNDDFYDEDYYQNTAPNQLEIREKELHNLVMEKYRSLNDQQKQEIARNARVNHPGWTPVRHEYLAMLDAMYEADEIPQPLKARAKSCITLELDQDFDGSMDGFDEEEGEFDFDQQAKQKRELHEAVNARLLELEQDEVDKLVEQAKARHPDWKPDSGLELFDELSDDLDETIASFESDGTFWGSLKTRFRMLDFVWLTLGLLSAFAIAFTLGHSGKKS